VPMDAREAAIQLGQKCLEATPVIVLGSGASMPYGVGGMTELRNHLLATVNPTPDDKATWDSFTDQLKKHNSDLESALQAVTLSDSLLDQVVRRTREMILQDELLLADKVLAREVRLTLTRLFNHLFNSTHHTLSVVTTNYDRLSEYAADVARVNHYTGFSGSYFKFFDNAAKNPRASAKQRTVEVWKVHGSLDWFKDQDGLAVALPCDVAFLHKLTPLIVTPGVTKYAATHQEPFRSIMQNSDAALVAARSFLCIGYGFRDEHIQPKLIERVQRDSIPIVVLARTLSDSARAFLAKCKHTGYLALEQAGTSTRAFFHGNATGIDIPNSSLWEFDTFLDATTTVA